MRVNEFSKYVHVHRRWPSVSACDGPVDTYAVGTILKAWTGWIELYFGLYTLTGSSQSASQQANNPV
jgi:hypothetical protein